MGSSGRPGTGDGDGEREKRGGGGVGGAQVRRKGGGRPGTGEDLGGGRLVEAMLWRDPVPATRTTEVARGARAARDSRGRGAPSGRENLLRAARDSCKEAPSPAGSGSAGEGETEAAGGLQAETPQTWQGGRGRAETASDWAGGGQSRDLGRAGRQPEWYLGRGRTKSQYRVQGACPLPHGPQQPESVDIERVREKSGERGKDSQEDSLPEERAGRLAGHGWDRVLPRGGMGATPHPFGAIWSSD